MSYGALGTSTSLAADVRCEGYYDAYSPADAAAYRAKFGAAVPVPSATTCRSGLLSGPIVVGDLERVRAVVRQSAPFVLIFYLNSAGGSVDEALRIGRFLRQNFIETRVPTSIELPDGRHSLMSAGEGRAPHCDSKRGEVCTCASACFFVWAGGAARVGNSLAIHRPYPVEAAARRMTASEADRVYRDLLGRLGAYFDEMGIPRKFLDLMTNVPSGQVRHLDWDEITHEIGEYPLSLAEWFSAQCVTFSREEYDLLIELGAKAAARPLRGAEKIAEDALFAKTRAAAECRGELLHRERLRVQRG